MRMKTRQTLAALLALVMLLALAPLGYADEGGTEDSPAVPADNSLTVDLASTNKADWGDEDIFDLALAADLYLIVPTKANPTDGYDFANATSDFKGSVKAIADAVYGEGYWDEATNAPSTSFVRDKDYKPDYEKLLNDTIIPVAIGTFNGEGKFTPTEVGATISGSYSKESTSKKIDITGLTSGMYLLVPHGVGENGTTLAKKDYVKSTEAGESNVTVTIAQTDTYSYLFTPQLISLPTKDPDENGVISTANPGDWKKELTVKLKPQREERMGDLEIVKSLDEYVDSYPATFVFLVKATDKDNKDKVVYNNVHTINWPEQKSVIIEKAIPIGAEVTVVETVSADGSGYDGSCYQYVTSAITSTGDPDGGKLVIAADKMASITFTNTHDDTDIGGYGIENVFVYNKDLKKWEWKNAKDSSADNGTENNETAAESN